VLLGGDVVWVADGGGGAVDIWTDSPTRPVRRVSRIEPTRPDRRLEVEDLASSSSQVAVAVQEVGKSLRVAATEEDFFLSRVLTFGTDLRVSEVARCVPEGRNAPGFVPTVVRVAEQAVVFQIRECARDGLDAVLFRDYGASPPTDPETIAGPEELLRDASGPFVLVGPGTRGGRAIELRSRTTANDLAAGDDGGGARVTPSGVIVAQRSRPAGRGFASYTLLERRPGMEPRPLGPVLRSPNATAASDEAVVFATDQRGLSLGDRAGRVRAIARYLASIGTGSLYGTKLAWAERTCYGQRFVLTDLDRIGRARDRSRCALRLARPPRPRRTVVDLDPICTSYVENCEGTARMTVASTGRLIASGTSRRLRLTRTGRRALKPGRRVQARIEVRMRDVRGRAETRVGRTVLRRPR